MKLFRVALSDAFNGETFTFAIFVPAANETVARLSAKNEFEGAVVVSAREVVDENLLQFSINRRLALDGITSDHPLFVKLGGML